MIDLKQISPMVAQRNMRKPSSKPESFGKELLTELANLHDAGADRFWRKWPFNKESSSTLYRLREQLRSIWEDRLSGGAELSYVLDHWVNYQHPGLESVGYKSWRVSLKQERILPTDKNLRGFLAFAVLIHFPLLAVCGNPECPVKYFVGRRHDQKYCERGDCTAYAQRQYALKHWREKGHLLRTQRMAAKKAGKKKNPMRGN